jgi:hypothetical protein
LNAIFSISLSKNEEEASFNIVLPQARETPLSKKGCGMGFFLFFSGMPLREKGRSETKEPSGLW